MSLRTGRWGDYSRWNWHLAQWFEQKSQIAKFDITKYEYRPLRWDLRSHSQRTLGAGPCSAGTLSAAGDSLCPRKCSAAQAAARGVLFSPLCHGGVGNRGREDVSAVSAGSS